MAFYTSRVDHEGNEIERRSLRIPTIAMSSEDSESTSDTGFDYDFEAKNFSDNCSLSHEMSMSDTASDFEFGSPKNMSDNLSLNEKMSMFDRDGDIVPPLDIRSELNFSGGNQLTYKSKRKYETAKIIMEPNKNVEDWLARKRQRQLDAAARQKREEEEKRQQAEERKRLAEEKYQKWLQKKKTNSNVAAGAISNRRPSTPAQPVAAAATTKRNTTAEMNSMDKQRKLEEWMRNKQKQENERRLREQKEVQKRAQLEAARKQLNNGAHEKWLERNKNAPKPVPLNQGLATLRGTVSKIFVNPNEWRTD